MQNTSAYPRAPVSFPNHNRIITPKNRQAKPSSQTDFKLIAPAGIGRSLRYCRSKFTSNASFKNIPAMYKKVAPIRTNGSLSEWWSPPSHQPAKQFDLTVGKFETRPRIKIVRRKDMKESCYNAKLSRLDHFKLARTALARPVVSASNHIQLQAGPRHRDFAIRVAI